MTLRARSYLVEATFNLDRDVDYLYEKSRFDPIAKAVASRDPMKMRRAMDRFEVGQAFYFGNSGELRSMVAKRAHKVNPVVVTTGIFRDGSYYSPPMKEIKISLNAGAFDILRQVGYMPDAASAMVGPSVFNRFMNEFSEKNQKATIYHELAHWADDTLHGSHIAKRLRRARESGDHSSIRGKYTAVTRTPMEMNAQVHAFKVLRQQMGKREYDKLTWGKAMELNSSFMSNFRNLRDRSDYLKTMKGLLRRLHREGLMGKTLSKFPSFEEMQQLVGSWAGRG